MAKKTKIVLIVLGVALLGTGIRVLGHRAHPAGAQTPSRLVTAVAEKNSIRVTVTGTSAVFSADKRAVRPKVSGTVREVLLKDGDKVERDQPIAVLDNEDVLLAYEQSVLDYESAVLSLESLTSVSGSDLSLAQSRLLKAQTSLRERQGEVSDLSLPSPSDGRIGAVFANAGDVVSANQPLFTLLDDTTLFAVVDVPQSEYLRLATGQRASLSFGSELPFAEGTVYSIGTEGTALAKDVSVPVSIRFANEQRVYRAGLAVNATIDTPDSAGSRGSRIYASGFVSANTKYEVKSATGGTIEWVGIKAGDEVNKGQRVIELSNPSASAALAAAEAEVLSAKESLERLDAGLAPQTTENQLRQQQMRVQQSESAMRKREAEKNSLTIRSPISGVLVSTNAKTGDSVSPSTDCFVVADYGAMQMVIPVDELDILSIQAGQAASVVLEALPNERFDAEVTEISLEGTVKDGIANFDVTLTLSEPSGVYAGMTARAQIVLAEKHDVLCVPAEAVHTQPDRRTVVVLQDGERATKEVQIGLTNGVITEIVAGLKEGDTVLISDDMPTFGPGTFGPHSSSAVVGPGGR